MNEFAQNRVFSMRFSVDLSGPMPRPASRNSWLFYWELSLGMSNTMLLILLTFLMLRAEQRYISLLCDDIVGYSGLEFFDQ